MEKMDTVKFLREKGLLHEDKETFKIIHDDAGEIVLNELLEEYSSDKEDKYVRLYADFENYKKRVRKNIQESELKGKISVLSGFFDTLDDIERAKSEGDLDEGTQLIFDKILNHLDSIGVKEVDCSGDFNPDIHECVTTVDTPGYEGSQFNKIIDVVSKGYVIDDIIVRYPKVIVSK